MTGKSSYLRQVSGNFIAMQRAAEQIARFYDAQLAPSGLRSAQFAMLVFIHRLGEASVHSIAEGLVLDRAIAGKNLRALEEVELVRIAPSTHGHRERIVTITRKGCAVLKAAFPLWQRAQSRFEEMNGAANAAAMRAVLGNLVFET